MDQATVTPSAARYHRRALGLTQTGLAEAADVSASYVKQFESERLRPSTGFLRKLAECFIERGVSEEKLAKEYSASGQIDTTPRARPGRVASMATVPHVEERQCFFIDVGTSEQTLEALMLRWEKNEDRIAELFKQEVKSGLIDQYSDESEKALQEVFGLLAENFVIFKLLTGWGLIEDKSVTADTVASVILTHYADVIRVRADAGSGEEITQGQTDQEASQ